jgi:RHS repeat-associated protein
MTNYLCPEEENSVRKTVDNGKSVEYNYDHQNRMTRRNSDYYVHDGWQIACSLRNGKVEHRYLWGAAQDELLAMDDAWALRDHLNTVRKVVDARGCIISDLEYNAFGALVNATDDKPLFRFTGKMFDDATGLQWNINRWYDSNVGRWISEDPIGFEAGDWNLARYVSNRVPFSNDPFGLAIMPYSFTPEWNGKDVGAVSLVCKCGKGPSTLSETIEIQVNAEGSISAAPAGVGLTGTLGFTVMRSWTFGMECDMSLLPYGNGYIRKKSVVEGKAKATINFGWFGRFCSITNIDAKADIYEDHDDYRHCCFATQQEWESNKKQCESEAKNWK